MTKQIKRFGPIVVILGLIGVVVFVAFAQPGPPGPPGPPVLGDPRIALAIRRTIGFGPTDVLPAFAGDNNHRGMINLARAFVADHEAVLAPLIETFNNAHKELIHAITWGEDPTTVRQAMEDARSAIAQAIVDLLPGLSDNVPPPFQAYIDTVLQNGQLDPDLRALNLTAAQREAILAAQQQRDNVLLNARNWHQKAKNEQAKAAFEDTLQSILTQPQRNQLANIRQTLAARLQAMMIAEAEPFNDG